MENEESRKGRRGVIAALVLCVSVALPTAAAERCDLTLEIRPAASDAFFQGLVVRSSDPPAGPIELEPGESVEGYVATLALSGDCPEDLRIEWQYETTMAVGDEGPHLDLDDWLHFTSEWREGDPVPGGGVTLPQLAAEKALPFPAFTHGELVEAVRRAGGERWERLVSTEEAAASSAYTGVSAYRLRVVDGSGSPGPLLLVELRLPLGC
jgi:hypothetical protein